MTGAIKEPPRIGASIPAISAVADPEGEGVVQKGQLPHLCPSWNFFCPLDINKICANMVFLFSFLIHWVWIRQWVRGRKLNIIGRWEHSWQNCDSPSKNHGDCEDEQTLNVTS